MQRGPGPGPRRFHWTSTRERMDRVPEEWKRDLDARLGQGRVETGVVLAPFTTFRIGGPADLFCRARTTAELCDVLTLARELEIPTFVLGRGANILVADAGFRGLVVKSEAESIELEADGRVRAAAGVQVFPDLIEKTLEWQLGGLHHFAGIPSTVGGAMWQNLHFLSPDRDRTIFIEEVVDQAEIFSAQGERKVVERDYFRFGYDYSVLHDQADTVLSVDFRLHRESRKAMEAVIRGNLAWRAARHPDLARFPSAGSVFRKIDGIGAGRLIDECGLKGEVLGSAQIYPRHANIIVNLGGATAAQVVALMDLAREMVRRETGYELVPEITLLGDL